MGTLMTSKLHFTCTSHTVGVKFTYVEHVSLCEAMCECSLHALTGIYNPL